MLKIEMKLNEDKIQKDNKYNLESILKKIDCAFGYYDFRKEKLADGTICFYGRGRRHDYASFGRLIINLKNEDWFVSNVTKWLWFNSDRGQSEDDYSVEDILYYFTKKESVV